MLSFLSVLLVTACASQPRNPSFDLSVDAAHADLKRMRADKVKPARPIVILGGFADPGLGNLDLATQLRKYLDEPTIISVAFVPQVDFEGCRERVIEAVDKALPTDDPDKTVEVDVLAISMGGLVAKFAATPMEGERTLRMARLFTYATPHRGARLAALPTVLPLMADMRQDASFIAELNEDWAAADVPVIPYVRLYDATVGAANASPPGVAPWWVPNRPLEPSHLMCHRDPRILADTLRRLRSEEPFTNGVAAPLPTDDDAEQ